MNNRRQFLEIAAFTSAAASLGMTALGAHAQSAHGNPTCDPAVLENTI